MYQEFEGGKHQRREDRISSKDQWHGDEEAETDIVQDQRLCRWQNCAMPPRAAA